MVLQLLKHFTTVEKITIRWTALSSFRTTGPWKEFSGLQGRTGGDAHPSLGRARRITFIYLNWKANEAVAWL